MYEKLLNTMNRKTNILYYTQMIDKTLQYNNKKISLLELIKLLS